MVPAGPLSEPWSLVLPNFTFTNDYYEWRRNASLLALPTPVLSSSRSDFAHYIYFLKSQAQYIHISWTCFFSSFSSFLFNMDQNWNYHDFFPPLSDRVSPRQVGKMLSVTKNFACWNLLILCVNKGDQIWKINICIVVLQPSARQSAIISMVFVRNLTSACKYTLSLSFSVLHSQIVLKEKCQN